MNDIGVFTPEQARALWQDYQRRQQLSPHISQNYPQRRPIDEPSPHRVFVKNTSDETCPAFGCMKITGVEVVGETTVVTIDKPDSADGEFLFNSQFAIEAGENGWAFRYGVVIALGNGTPPTEANVSYQPVADSWAIEEGGGFFTVFGEHNVVSDAVIGRFEGGGGGNQSIEFTVVEMDCETDPWLITAEVTWFSGGCTAEVPGEDSYGRVAIQNRCNIANFFTDETIVGKTGTATYRYPRTGTCTPAWRLDDICGSGDCGT